MYLLEASPFRMHWGILLFPNFSSRRGAFEVQVLADLYPRSSPVSLQWRFT